MQVTLRGTDTVRYVKSFSCKLCGYTEGTKSEGRPKNTDRMEEKPCENGLVKLKRI